MLSLTNIQKGCYTDYGFSGYGVAVKLVRKNRVVDRLVREMAEALMLSIAGNCSELRARAIGHIKSYIRTPVGSIKADTIGVSHGAYSSGRFSRPVENLHVNINSIVQGIPEGAVKAATLEGLYEIAETYDFSVIKKKEHLYFNEFDSSVSGLVPFHLPDHIYPDADDEDEW